MHQLEVNGLTQIQTMNAERLRNGTGVVSTELGYQSCNWKAVSQDQYAATCSSNTPMGIHTTCFYF